MRWRILSLVALRRSESRNSGFQGGQNKVEKQLKEGQTGMSTRVLCGSARMAVCQTAGLQAVRAIRLGRTRTFSGASSDEPYIAVSQAQSGPSTVWPDEKMGPFGPQDRRFQLPGNTGFDCHLEGVGNQKLFPLHRTVPDVLSAPTSGERHEFVLAQFVSEFQTKEANLSLRMRKAEQYFEQMSTDCTVNSCPELLRKDLDLYFPAVPTGGITVVTVTQRNERLSGPQESGEQLLGQFVTGAKEMCFALWTAGYWADFIDPMTGAAFFGSVLPTSVVAEGDRRHQGFQIEASGSCTVIRHVLRGTPVFVGTVFTNAPTYSSTVARLRGLANVR
ncbi:methylmalonic aciduria and homocystinuria type D homolog, mitochondrial isoform X1 [Gadus morhua]|nr:methylmalonic aciduria and homocystinuria type D homolog, mitochondrial-like isoform X1 [Gadus morhua]